MLENIIPQMPMDSTMSINIPIHAELNTISSNKLHTSFRTIDNFIGGFEASKLNFIESTNHFLFDLIHQLCVKAVISYNKNVIYIDGGNSLNPYTLTTYCKRYRAKPKLVFSKIKISRAFTAYQLSSLIDEELEKRVDDTSLVVVSRILDLLLDENVKKKEAGIMLERGIKKIKELTENHNLISIITNYKLFRHFSFRKIIYQNADKIVRIENHNKKCLRVRLEDRFLDYFPVPIYQMTLDDFIGGISWEEQYRHIEMH